MKSHRFEYGIYGLLILLTASAYWPALGCGFVNFDDPSYVTQNPQVQAGLTPSGIYYAFTTFDVGNWIPLTWLSYLLDTTFFGSGAAGYHFTNVVLHICNVCLLFLMLRRMTNAPLRSAVVAALFAVHPLHVESVAWISERKDVLSTFWLLASLAAYERYAATANVRWYLLVCVAAVLGLLAKSMIVTLPLLLLLIDFWPLERWSAFPAPDARYPLQSSSRLILEKLPLAAIAFADGLITIVAQRSQTAMWSLEQLPLWFRLGNALRAFGWYLQKTIVPTDLCNFYPLPTQVPSWHTLVAVGFIMAAITIAVVLMGQRQRYLFTGWLWFLIALAPVIGVLQVGSQAQADRYVYIPHIGLFTMLIWMLAGTFSAAPSRRWIGLGIAAVMIAAGFWGTQRQIRYWQNSIVLWQQADRVSPDDYMVGYYLGMALTDDKRFREAEVHFRKSLASLPDSVPAILGLGHLRIAEGNVGEAKEYLLWAKRLEPRNERADKLLRLLAEQTQPSEDQLPVLAERSVEAKAEVKSGLAQARAGKFDDALHAFEAALRIDPAYPEAHNNAGLSLMELGRLEEAEQRFRQALEVDPQNADYHVNLAGVLLRLNRVDEAREQFAVALRLKPHDVDVQFRLEQLESQSGKK